jgi:RNA recognition motif. (a.k.a. RRM, RBD, or RNP domain)
MTFKKDSEISKFQKHIVSPTASTHITAQNQQQPTANNPPQTLPTSTYDAGIVKDSSTGSVNNMNEEHQVYEANSNAKLSDSGDAFETVEEKVTAQPPQSNEPKTYANLVKSGGSGLSFAASIGSGGMMSNSGPVNRSAMSPPPMQKHQSTQQQSQQQQQQASSGPPHGSGGYQPDHRQRQHDGGRMDMGRGDGNVGMRDDQRGMNRPPRGERRTSNTNSVNYGDSHQVFVGNIPHAATEDELRNLFGQFGQIVDLRILSKPPQKTPGQWAPPNYGFIIFEEQQAAADCLANTVSCVFPCGRTSLRRFFSFRCSPSTIRTTTPKRARS